MIPNRRCCLNLEVKVFQHPHSCFSSSFSDAMRSRPWSRSICRQRRFRVSVLPSWGVFVTEVFFRFAAGCWKRPDCTQFIIFSNHGHSSIITRCKGSERKSTFRVLEEWAGMVKTCAGRWKEHGPGAGCANSAARLHALCVQWAALQGARQRWYRVENVLSFGTFLF